MDGQNFGNGQDNNYQDYTANLPYQSTPYPEDNGSGSASGVQIAGFVLGILSMLFGFCYGIPSIIFGIIGLICAIVGNRKNKHGIGTAGLVCSIVGIIAGICWLIYYIVYIGVLLASGVFDAYLSLF